MRRHLPLLLLLYVALDFANPLMPGAVRLEAGSIEIVQADRTARAARPAAAPARVDAVFPAWSIAPTGATLHRPAPVPLPVSARVLRAARRAPPRRVTPPPSPAEDH